MYSVYILYSRRVNKLYVGFTANLQRRIKEHKNGKVTTTKEWLPLIFIYAELYADKKDASRREKFFKTGWGRRYIQKILTHTLRNLKSSKI